MICLLLSWSMHTYCRRIKWCGKKKYTKFKKQLKSIHPVNKRKKEKRIRYNLWLYGFYSDVNKNLLVAPTAITIQLYTCGCFVLSLQHNGFFFLFCSHYLNGCFLFENFKWILYSIKRVPFSHCFGFLKEEPLNWIRLDWVAEFRI